MVFRKRSEARATKFHNFPLRQIDIKELGRHLGEGGERCREKLEERVWETYVEMGGWKRFEGTYAVVDGKERKKVSKKWAAQRWGQKKYLATTRVVSALIKRGALIETILDLYGD